MSVESTDACDEHPAIRLVSITSDESADAEGSGHTDPDVQDAAFGTDDHSILLRAEPNGISDGRTYTIAYEAEDGSGNVTPASVTVTVPKSQGARSPAVSSGWLGGNLPTLERRVTPRSANGRARSRTCRNRHSVTRRSST